MPCYEGEGDIDYGNKKSTYHVGNKKIQVWSVIAKKNLKWLVIIIHYSNISNFFFKNYPFL